MAKYDEIRYADLARFLEGLGFVRRKLDDAHFVWEHPQFGSRLFLPAYRAEDTVWANSVFAIRATLARDGVLERDDFDRWRLGLGASEPPNGRDTPPGKGRKRAGKPGKAST